MENNTTPSITAIVRLDGSNPELALNSVEKTKYNPIKKTLLISKYASDDVWSRRSETIERKSKYSVKCIETESALFVHPGCTYEDSTISKMVSKCLFTLFKFKVYFSAVILY